jgi:anti-sigma regulatory factor (Ser/Thr protein kinase)
LEQDDPDFELALDERPIGGLGIFLIKTLPASVSYARAGGRNVLTLCFRTTEAA